MTAITPSWHSLGAARLSPPNPAGLRSPVGVSGFRRETKVSGKQRCQEPIHSLFNANASAAQRFGVGLNIAVGGASVVSTGDRGLQQALRALSIASGIWNTGTEAVTAYQTSRATMEALRPTPIVAASGGRVTQTGYSSDRQIFTEEDAGWQPMDTRRRSDPQLEGLFNGEPSGFIEQFMQTDSAAVEGSLNLRQKLYLWNAQGELPMERDRLSSLQGDWWWSRDNAAIAASVRRIARLESTIENFNGNDIQNQDIHSADESVFWSGTKGFGNGLKTGAKANVNGLSSAAAGFATLGYVDGVEVWAVQQDDIEGGYGTALIFARAGGELLLVASPTGLANIAAKGGKISQAARYSGYTMRAVDTATNAHDASESAYRMMSQSDFSLGNTTQFATSTMGFAGDYSELNKVLDSAGYKVSFSGFGSGPPMHIGPKSARAFSKPIYKTTKEATLAANVLGFTKINETVHEGQAVYRKGKNFITRDLDGHNGGAWKHANSVKALGSKETRAGTLDINLNRIGD